MKQLPKVVNVVAKIKILLSGRKAIYKLVVVYSMYVCMYIQTLD